MSTCNQLDLQTLGSQLIMPKNLPDHCLCELQNKGMINIQRSVKDREEIVTRDTTLVHLIVVGICKQLPSI